MAPLPIPDDTLPQEAYTRAECLHCFKEHIETSTNNNNNIEKCPKIDAYDVMLPKNDKKFMAPIRRWEKKMGFVTPLRWINIFMIGTLHIVGIFWFIGVYITGYFTGVVPLWKTVFFGFLVGEAAGFGVTGGVHRFWTHRSYKAKLPLKLILHLCYSIAGQNTIFEWVRDHRVHHKFSETTADPHNANRGFFFAHVGWLMMKKHPDVIKEGSKIDMSDITSDPLIKFHDKYFGLFKFLFCFFLPTLVPVYFWNECWTFAILSQPVVRYLCSLNFTWSVNSFAHLWGNKPYDKHIMPTENWGVSVVALGEGWHNYHHTFPWDYKAAELAYSTNFTTVLIDLFALFGWAYDMKKTSPALIESVIQNRGEGRKDR